MKITCCADIHAHNFKQFDYVTDKSGSYRLDLITKAFQDMVEYAIAEKIELITIAGDVFHTRGKVSTISYNAMYDVIKSATERGINFLIVAGNHDQYDNSDSPSTSVHGLSGIPGVTVVESIQDFEFENSEGEKVWLRCVPYNKNTTMLRDFMQSESQDNTILVAHLGLSGAVTGKDSYPMQDAFTLEDLGYNNYLFTVLGHYHKGQIVDMENKVFYCGSLTQHSFNDEGNTPGFRILDTKERSLSGVCITTPCFVTHTLQDISEGELQEHVSKGNFVRFCVTEDEVDTIKSIVPEGLQYTMTVEKSFKKETRVDIQIGMSFQEVISKYAEEFNPDVKSLGLTILEEVLGEQ